MTPTHPCEQCRRDDGYSVCHQWRQILRELIKVMRSASRRTPMAPLARAVRGTLNGIYRVSTSPGPSSKQTSAQRFHGHR